MMIIIYNKYTHRRAKTRAVGPISALCEWDQDENHHRAQLDRCTQQFGLNPPGGLGAGLRQTDRQTDGQTSSFRYKIHIYAIILLMDTVPLSLTSVCGAYFWSLQTEFWADRFAKCLKMFHLTYLLYYKVLSL